MIRIGICDDLPEEVRADKAMVQRIADRLGWNLEIDTFEDGEELLQAIDNCGYMDILLLDIEMEGKNGIETARIIRETDFHTVLIFISAYDKYCKEMIEVQPFAFLDKPVIEERMEEVLKKIMRIKFEDNERFLFSSRKRRYSIPLCRIMYFESIGRQICIHCAEEEYYFYGKLSAAEKQVGGSQIKFARVQVSYLVNLNFIREWNYDAVTMDDGTVISISKKYRKDMKRYYMWMLEKEL